ncbi:MAG: DUF4956 domain-containing protein [Verrucomicrobia bacterium]|nr:DUF4956 domain-containing protein [Verrucomicrobiota bacterium]
MNIPAWLEPSAENGAPITLAELVWRIGLAFLLGCVVAGIYRRTHRSTPFAPTFPRTLVLLSILIAMVTQVIGDNIARAFSLVGALSIVRFRTVVQDTQDTAFVIFAVIVGMAVGADHLWVAIVGIGIVTVAIFVLRPPQDTNHWTQEESTLCVRVGLGTKPEAILKPLFEKHLRGHEFLGVETARQGTALELTYRVRLANGSAPLQLVEEIKQLEGVQNVDLRRASE